MFKQYFHLIIVSAIVFCFFELIDGCSNNSNPVNPQTTPSAPTLIYPNQGDTVTSSNIIFQWNVSPGASSYCLQVATDTGFKNPIVSQPGLANTTDTIPAVIFSYSTKYYWRVNASNSKGTSSYSSVRNFISTNISDDDSYLRSILVNPFSSNQTDDENILYNELFDMNDLHAITDNGSVPYIPFDSLSRWGRLITGSNLLTSITSQGDTLKFINYIKNIYGNYNIIGYRSGQIDSVSKPYFIGLTRNVVFKRISRNPNPRYNWRMWQVSLLNGKTTQPQDGANYSQITQIKLYINGYLAYTFIGSDFTQNVFNTRFFGGAGIPGFHTGDQIKIDVTVSSVQQTNYVIWHWPRNTFGYYRIPFTFVSSSPGGNGYIDTFSKTFTIYPQHQVGSFNGFISAMTHESIFDDAASLLAATEVSIPYRVLP